MTDVGYRVRVGRRNYWPSEGQAKVVDDLLTTEEAARLLGKARRTVRGYITRGLLPVARKPNARLILVTRAAVERLKRNLPPSHHSTPTDPSP